MEEYCYTVYTHCNILVDMYLDKHVTTPGCQFYVDLYPPLHYLFLRYVYVTVYAKRGDKLGGGGKSDIIMDFAVIRVRAHLC